MYNTDLQSLVNLTNTITEDRMQEIERQRGLTYADPAFQAWMRRLGVSTLWQDRSGRIRAAWIMSEWSGY